MSIGIYLVTYLIIPIVVVFSIRRKKDEYENLDKETTDSIKGVLVLGVVLSHLATKVNKGPFLLQFPFGQIGMYCVILFFFLSGYGLIKSYIKKGEVYLDSFWSRKIVKLYIPFIIVNIISVIMRYPQKHNISFLDLILNILGIKLIDTTLWFIQTIFIFYLVFYIVIKYFKNKAIEAMLVSSIMYILIEYCIGAGVWQIDTSISFFIGFLYGYRERIISKFMNWHYRNVLVGSCILFIITKFISMKFYTEVIDIIFVNISSIFFIIFTVLILYKISIKSTILKFIKNYSYEMYLLHMKVMLILNTNKPVRVLEIMIFLSMLFFLSIIFSKLCNIINKIYSKIFN